MNAKSILGAAVAGLWWASSLFAQQPYLAGRDVPLITPVAPGGPAAVAPLPVGPGPQVPTGLSDWILYRRADCCSAGPVTPLYSELFLRVGPSFVLGGNYLGRDLQTGWSIEGGVRGLLFNTAMTSAFVIEAHIVNSHNSGGGGRVNPTVLDIILPDEQGQGVRQDVAVTVRSMNRTLVGLGVGREWYFRPADEPGNKWRFGVDGGGRYGSGSQTYNEIRHRTDVMGGVWAAAHTDYEIPCGCCFLTYGMRVEWAYTWSDILQRQSDVQEINLLATFGIRY